MKQFFKALTVIMSVKKKLAGIMSVLKSTFAKAALATGVVAAITGGVIAYTSFYDASASSSATTAAAPAATPGTLQWVNATPSATRTDPNTVRLVNALRPDLNEQSFTARENLELYAYQMRFGGDSAKYIIATATNSNFCGTIGCQTFIFRQTDATKNTWSQVFDQNVNSLSVPTDPSRLAAPTIRTIDDPAGFEEEWTFTNNTFNRKRIAPGPARVTRAGTPQAGMAK